MHGERSALMIPLRASSGDWALERMAGVFFEGSERALVEGCAFERLDARQNAYIHIMRG